MACTYSHRIIGRLANSALRPGEPDLLFPVPADMSSISSTGAYIRDTTSVYWPSKSGS